MKKILLSCFSLFASYFLYAQSPSNNNNGIVNGQSAILSDNLSEMPTTGGTGSIALAAKIILSGPYDPVTGLMNDQLRASGMIPLDEPYTNPPYQKPVIAIASGEQVSQDILSVTGNDAIVDWIFIELRSGTNSSELIATRRALIQRDGDVVSHIDGISPVEFEGVAAGNYFVGIKHRNHLGVMTSSALLFVMNDPTVYDFTTSPIWVKAGEVNAPCNMFGTVAAMWSADANRNKGVKYSGLSNDKQEVLNAIGPGTPNNILYPVYRAEDLNMDAVLKYNNANNDRNVIAGTVGVSTLNNIVNQHVPN